MSKITHKLVAETAKAIAAEVYEVCASNDRFYHAYPNLKVFVRRCWPQFIKDARKALTQMLQPIPGSDPKNPRYQHTEHIRTEIFEALCLEGEMKGAPELDLNALRMASGFEPVARHYPGLVH